MNQELTTPTQLENHLWASANILRGPVDATEILGWYHGFAFVQDAGRVVTLDEIKAEDWTLNIWRYVLPPPQEDIPPLPDAITAFKDALTHCRETEERLVQVMTEGGWLQ